MDCGSRSVVEIAHVSPSALAATAALASPGAISAAMFAGARLDLDVPDAPVLEPYLDSSFRGTAAARPRR